MKKVKQIHITPTTFENESRLLKEGTSALNNKVVDIVYVIAKYGSGLKSREVLNNGIIILRPNFYISRALMKLSVLSSNQFKKIMIVIYAFRILMLRPSIINIHCVNLIQLVRLKNLIHGIKVIYDAHELETEANGLLEDEKLFLKEIEKKYIPRVDHTFVVSPSIERWYRDTYNIDRISTVMNTPLKHKNLIRQDLFREKYKLGVQDTLFIYNGALFEGRGIKILLEVFEKITDKSNHMVFMGEGELETVIVEYEKRNTNIHLHKAVEPSKVIEYTACADVGISLGENICLSYYYSLPNKIFEYLIAEIPIITANMQDMKNFVINNKVGMVAETYEVADVTKTIEAMALDKANYKEALLIAKEKYNWENEEKKMIHIYKRLINK